MKRVKDLRLKFLFRVDSSEWFSVYLATTTVMIAICSFMFSAERANVSQNFDYHKSLWFWAGIILLCGNLAILLCKAIFLGLKFQYMKLYLDLGTGYLYDTKANLQNVALRKKSLILILKNYKSRFSTEGLFLLGKEIGESFAVEFRDKQSQKHGDYNQWDNDRKINAWLQYDSCSGWGKFNVKEKMIGQPSVITVVNSFATDENCNLCEFLRGYIKGCLEVLLNRGMTEIDVTKGNCANSLKCEFSFT